MTRTVLIVNSSYAKVLRDVLSVEDVEIVDELLKSGEVSIVQGVDFIESPVTSRFEKTKPQRVHGWYRQFEKRPRR